MSSQPFHDDAREINLLTHRQLTSLRNAMPLLQTSTAATACGVLGDKGRKDAMAHGRLLAVVGNGGRSQPPGNGLSRALLYLFPTLVMDISFVLGIEIKRTAKPALGQSLKKRRKVYALHLFFIFSSLSSVAKSTSCLYVMVYLYILSRSTSMSSSCVS